MNPKNTKAHEHRNTCTLRVRLCALVLLTCLTAPNMSFAAGGDLIPAFGTGGVITSNPSGGVDRAYDIAIDASAIYIAGSDASLGNDRWRIEKRDLTTGALIIAFDVDGIITEDPNPGGNSDIAYDIAVDATNIYVAGGYFDASIPIPKYQWRIRQYNKTTGLGGWTYVSTLTGTFAGPYDITVDASGVYAVGYDNQIGNHRWRIGKHSLITGALIATFGPGDTNALIDGEDDGNGVVTYNPSGIDEHAVGVAVNASGIYVTGEDISLGAGNGQWRIQKHDLATGVLIAPAFDTDGIVLSNPPGDRDDYTASIAVNAGGIYIGGIDASSSISDTRWRVEKRDLTSGALINVFDGDGIITSNPSIYLDELYAIALDTSGIYLAGVDSTSSMFDTQWRIEKRDLTTGELIPVFGTNGVVTSNMSTFQDAPSSIAVNAGGIYVVGYDSFPGNAQWRIEKRELGTVAYSDCGVRMRYGALSGKMICENPPVSSLRVQKNNITYGIKLVDPTYTSEASRFRVQTPTGVKALAKYGEWVLTNAYNACSPPVGACTYTGASPAPTPCTLRETYCVCQVSCSGGYRPSCWYTPYFYECQ